MRARLVVGVAALGLTAFVPSVSADPPKPAWQVLRNEDGIVVAKQEIPGSALLAFRGEGDIDAPILAVGSVIVDDKQATQWVDSAKECRLLRRISDTEQVTYTHIATPFILADRETVTREKLVVDPVKKTVVIHVSSVNDPLAPKTSYVRVLVDRSLFSLASVDGGKKTHVIAEIHADPGGNVPSWVANQFQKSWGYNTIMNLRRQVQRSKAIDPGLKALLEPPAAAAP